MCLCLSVSIYVCLCMCVCVCDREAVTSVCFCRAAFDDETLLEKGAKLYCFDAKSDGTLCFLDGLAGTTR